jgi:4-alpha-glucanotransferase
MDQDAAAWGIWSHYTDGLGRDVAVDRHVITRIRDALASEDSLVAGARGAVHVLTGGNRRIEHFAAHGAAAVWDIAGNAGTVATAMVEGDALSVPQDLPIGVYELRPRDADAPAPPVSLIVAPERVYQGPPGRPLRTWLIAVQLYGVRSRGNWGHGDFSDLALLLDCAAQCGAGGIGLNPLHMLFDDRPDHISPYSPNSRRFLDPLYIDVERIAEFPGAGALDLASEIARLRDFAQIDYAGVRAAKFKALRACHAAFRAGAGPARRRAFDDFRAAAGGALRRFACFETLRRRFKEPWWLWPAPWRAPGDADIEALAAESGAEIEFHEYVQWIADTQLGDCCRKARRLGLPVGLYLDLAVGVVPDGADAWCNHGAMLQGLSIGAPPDQINLQGQNWGLTTFSPASLAARRFEPYRLMLSAAMRHAGAVRIDHVLGLNRLFVVPDGLSAAGGTYLDFPVEALLAVTAEQSERHRCIVIGEDLGTVPGDFREKMRRWGLWSYRVMQFERDAHGDFHAPEQYFEPALVTFTTHDLPTFAGWWAGEDLKVRREIGLDPGETDAQRESGRDALRRALSRHGGWSDGDFVAVARYLADAPSHLLAISLEDIVGAIDQPNIPGSIHEYPNWRMRSPVAIEDLMQHSRLPEIAAAMRQAGRAPR